MAHSLSLCGILLFGTGGFMLISAWDNEKRSLITSIGACALLVIGAALFAIGIFDFTGSNATGLGECTVPAC